EVELTDDLQHDGAVIVDGHPDLAARGIQHGTRSRNEGRRGDQGEPTGFGGLKVAARTTRRAGSERLLQAPSGAVGAVSRGALDARKVERGVDERYVRERLRKVAELASHARVVLLGEEPDVVAELE